MPGLVESEKQFFPLVLAVPLRESPITFEKAGLRTQPPSHPHAEGLLLTMANFSFGWKIPPDCTSSKIINLFSRLQAQGVSIRQQMELYEYLSSFPDMIDALEEAVLIARDHLREAELELEVYHDPESEDEDKHLVLYARFPSYDRSIMKRVRSVRQRYRDFVLHKSGWLFLTTDFQKPK